MYLSYAIGAFNSDSDSEEEDDEDDDDDDDCILLRKSVELRLSCKF